MTAAAPQSEALADALRRVRRAAMKRALLLDTMESCTRELRAAVSDVCAAGMSEGDAARAAGVTRKTVRDWRGKAPRVCSYCNHRALPVSEASPEGWPRCAYHAHLAGYTGIPGMPAPDVDLGLRPNTKVAGGAQALRDTLDRAYFPGDTPGD